MTSSSASERRIFYAVLEDPVYLMEGKEALDLLQRISTNDVQPVLSGQSVSTILTNEKGRVVDILGVCGRSGEGSLILGGQRKPAEDVRRWVEKFIIMEDAAISVAADDWSQMQCWSTSSESDEWQFPEPVQANGMFVIREKFGMGESARLLVPRDKIKEYENYLRSLSAMGMKPHDHERSRILAGIPKVGAEITEATHPMEARLVSRISFTKGCYVGQEVVARLDTYRKVQRILTRVSGRGALPEVPAVVRDHDGTAVGDITSAAGLDTGIWRGIAIVREHVLLERSTQRLFVGDSELTLLDHDHTHGVYPER